ncbi:MAG: bis(5'-nucleosyl)-tetraphosphatase (symmetrical) YqeK [Endomicrobium sp.]|jgi:predicted HD superfamily hydrolase involved in NAD metabolism|nr:bis(5'-nucleosyl)-tetraphosphatase (symmetrical) YqeK [Endomicrobium sp.]
MKNIEKQIFDYLSKHLTPKRFKHSYNVAILAVELASKNNIDILKAQTAGLLHDCAKYMTDKELVNFLKGCNKSFKYFKEIVKFSPHLLHSFAGEIIAKKEFKIKDKNILNAIKNHTQGRENMSILEKIIFVADSVSNDRKWSHVRRLQNLAKQDLDKAFFEVLTKKIEYVIDRGIWLLPQTVDTWNWYVSNNKKAN